jgi:SpoIID/LytB domain protein
VPRPATPVTATAPAPPPPVILSDAAVQVQLCAGQRSVRVVATDSLVVHTESGERVLAAGTWLFAPAQVTPARQRWHVLTKTFQPGEGTAATEYVAGRRAEGLSAELLTTGKRSQTTAGRQIDNRLYWVSLGQYPSLNAAQAFGKQLEKAGEWTFIRAETVAPGQGSLTVSDAAGKAVAQCPLPLRLESVQPLEMDGVENGFWQNRSTAGRFSGAIDLRIGADGLLEVVEQIALENYLAGVLPAEMPVDWPMEALQAQAVAARSEVLASLAGKHGLEGFDFCATEHCRAYVGHGGRAPRTDAALVATAGQALLCGGKFVPAVFSATCGGWTEHNENVWSAPPDAALRGRPDMASASGASRSPMADPEGWVQRPPEAFCAADDRYFRWERRMTQRELSEAVNKRYSVGTVQTVECGERGVSGRLKWVRVVGSTGSERISKELPIRFGFGGLPSAMFIIQKQMGKDGAPVFVFSGAGRGHGVGLCQYGARGMALAGYDHTAILHHYYPGAEVETLE